MTAEGGEMQHRAEHKSPVCVQGSLFGKILRNLLPRAPHNGDSSEPTKLNGQVWGIRTTQDFSRGPSERTKRTIVLSSYLGVDLARLVWHSNYCLLRESRFLCSGLDSSPSTVVFSPKSAVSDISHVLFTNAA